MFSFIKPIVSESVSQLLQLGNDAVCPFKEQPSVDEEDENRNTLRSSTSPTSLFSMFTADIIKERVIFTR